MVPLLLELALGMAVAMIGTALAASSGDANAAAFSLGQQVAGLLFILLRIIGAGISVVLSQQLGAGQADQARTTARASIAGSVWLGLALALLAAAPAHTWMRVMQAPQEVAGAAAHLLVALSPMLVLDAVLSAQSSTLRAHLHVRATLVLSLVVQGVHLGLAVLLMPQMGLPGYAIGMVASRAVGVVLAGALCARLVGLPWRWSDLVRRPPPHTLSEVLHVGLPAAAENILYRVCATVSVAVAGSLGASTLAAHAYASQFNLLTVLPGLALGLTMEVLVGHAVGERALRQAHRRVLRALAAGLVCSVAVAAALAAAGPWLAALYTDDAAVAALVVTALWWTVVLEPGRTFNIVVINALRAAGDTRFPVMAGAVSMVTVLAGGSWWLGSHLGWGLAGIWIAYAADEWIRGLIMWVRWRQLHWLPHAREVVRRRRGRAAPPQPRPLEAPPSCR